VGVGAATRQGALESGKLPRQGSLVAALSELAASVQRGRSADDVLETAGRGVLALGMRLVAFEVSGSDLVLRYLATPPSRKRAIERRLGVPLRGLRAPIADRDVVRAVVEGRRIVYREDLDLFDSFLRHVAAFDPSELDAMPDTAGIANGLLAPIYVREEPWGILSVVSDSLTRDDADAVALFATHVGSALEVAESIEALEQAQRELVKRERLAALGELAAVVAHEVRNPLGVLFNSIGQIRANLRSPGKTDENETLLRIAAEEADRLNRLVGDLLDFARPNEPRLVPRAIEDVVRDAVAEAAPARIDVEVASDLPLVPMDAQHMRRALLNLVLNGVQASPEDHALSVRARADGAFVRIDVADHGAGIPDDVRASIFEPFFTTKASGTGLGLAVVKRIVDAHRGTIEIASTSAGTTFSILLPT
jgi:signal transduction histidine kinase